MQYINPYELLGIAAENLSDIDSSAIIKSKRKLLAEIELSDTNSIQFNGIEVSRGECIRIIDDLDNKDKREFHFFIFHQRYLNSFLTKGELNFFESYQSQNMYTFPEFIDFISPFFADKYDKVLLKNFKDVNNDEVKKILLIKPITIESDFEKCYKSTLFYLRETDSKILRIRNEIENGNSNLINDKFNRLEYEIIKLISISTINLLPSYFQGVRNQLGRSINNLSTIVFNNPYNAFIPAFKVIEYAKGIYTDGLIRQTILKDYYLCKKFYERENDKGRIILKSPTNSSNSNSGDSNSSKFIFEEIKRLSIEINLGHSYFIAIEFKGLAFHIQTIVQPGVLNILSNSSQEFKNEIAEFIRDIAVVINNNPYNNYEIAFEIIKIAKSINTNGEDSTSIQRSYEVIKVNYNTLVQNSNNKNQERSANDYGRPIRKVPSLSTINGIGTKLYGDTVYDVLFFIPIYPKARYNVEVVGYNRYKFLGELEFTEGQKLYRKYSPWVFISLIILLILWGILNSNSNLNNPYEDTNSSVNAKPYSEPESNSSSINNNSSVPSSGEINFGKLKPIDTISLKFIPKRIKPFKIVNLKEKNKPLLDKNAQKTGEVKF